MWGCRERCNCYIPTWVLQKQATPHWPCFFFVTSVKRGCLRPGTPNSGLYSDQELLLICQELHRPQGGQTVLQLIDHNLIIPLHGPGWVVPQGKRQKAPSNGLDLVFLNFSKTFDTVCHGIFSHLVNKYSSNVYYVPSLVSDISSMFMTEGDYEFSC